VAGPAIVITGNGFPQSKPDGYRLSVKLEAQPVVSIQGADGRGALYGVGQFLRRVEWDKGRIEGLIRPFTAVCAAFLASYLLFFFTPSLAEIYETLSVRQFRRTVRLPAAITLVVSGLCWLLRPASRKAICCSSGCRNDESVQTNNCPDDARMPHSIWRGSGVSRWERTPGYVARHFEISSPRISRSSCVYSGPCNAIWLTCNLENPPGNGEELPVCERGQPETWAVIAQENSLGMPSH
jgi:hypothetical protein